MTDRTSPAPSSPEAQRRMQLQRVAGTEPEMLIRRALHARGLRYRVNVRPIQELRRSADIVFTKKKVAVFVDGCFWHACPEHRSLPHSNSDWWQAKLQQNSTRDRDTDQQLQQAGWAVLRIWEHEDPTSAVERVVHALSGSAVTHSAEHGLVTDLD